MAGAADRPNLIRAMPAQGWSSAAPPPSRKEAISISVKGASSTGAEPELIVVGGGVIGVACAWRASRAAITTTVLDAAGHDRATDVAAGMIAPVGEAGWGEEDLLQAALASANAWPSFAAELERASGLPVPYRRCGAIHVALDRDEAAELQRQHEFHERLGLPTSWLRGSQCRRLEPGLATAVRAGFEAPEEAEIDPRALLAALTAAAVAAGASFEPETQVAELLVEDGVARGVRRSDGSVLRSGRVLLAAGAHSGELLAGSARIPIRPVKGEVVRLRAAAGERPCERLIVTERVYIVPRQDGEVVVGATSEDRGFDTRVRAGALLELLREAYRVLPEIAELELAGCAAGLRPGTPDNAPAVGWSGVEGLLVATGHFRNGILLAPITCAAIEALLIGSEPPAEVGALSPARFERVVGGATR